MLVSRDLCKRLFTKKCLWLLRMSPADIGKLHVADLSNRFGVSGQGLDIVELAAVSYSTGHTVGHQYLLPFTCIVLKHYRK